MDPPASFRAIAHYRAAADRTASLPERDYLTLKAARLAAGRRTAADRVTDETG